MRWGSPQPGEHGEARTLIQAGEGKPIAREIKDDRVNLLPTGRALVVAHC